MAGSQTWREVAQDVAQAASGGGCGERHDRGADANGSGCRRSVPGRPLLDQIDDPIVRVTADGAYDGVPTYQTIAQHGDGIEVVIPPRATAISSGELDPPTQRDRHLTMTTEQGRLAWQVATHYGQRSLVETIMGRHKALIGPRLRSRSFVAKQTKAAIGVAVLNRMSATERPDSVRRQPVIT